MSDHTPFVISPGHLTLAELYDLWRAERAFSLDPAARAAIDRSAATVAAVVRDNRRVYGITTGFGSLAKTTISPDQVSELQRRLVLSHCAGVGAPFDDEVVRLVMILKINALGRGFSGIRAEVIEYLLALLNAGAYPVIPCQGSVGASGDLAPLAHLSATLMGVGELRQGGRVRPAAEVLSELGLAPVRLEAKEGLALLNGTQVSTALALLGLFKALDVFAAALVAGAMSVDAALGTDVPFDPRIQAVRGHPGQIAVAGVFRRLLAGSEIRESHLDCDRVQDPYSLRCQPQVMGAALDVLTSAAAMIGREANAVSDNPLVFAEDIPEEGDVLSGGNFHAEPVAMAADMIAIALAEIGALSERRTALLTDAAMSSLPAFLIAEPGLNSGFMIAQVTAAALASENKSLANPASVDSLPTSANQEDHVSMATFAARRLTAMAANSGRIVAIELLAAAQGVDLRSLLYDGRASLKTGAFLEQVKARLRRDVAFLDQDREMSPDIEKAYRLIESGWLRGVAWDQLPEPPLG